MSPDRTSDPFFSQIVGSIPAMIAVYDIHTGTYLYVNQASDMVLGYQPDVFTKKGIAFATSLVHPDDLKSITVQNKDALERANATISDGDNDVVEEFEYRMKHADGTWRWIHTIGRVFGRDESGSVMSVINISSDVTHRKRTEEKLIRFRADLDRQKKLEKELRESRAHHQNIISVLAEGIVLQDTKGRIVSANASAQHMLGLAFDNIYAGTSLQSTWKAINEEGDMLEDEEYPAMIALRTRQPYTGAVMGIPKKDGTRIWIMVNATPLFNQGRKSPYAVVTSFYDITEQKETERRKDEFITMASHELKTPVTSIKAFNQILKKYYGASSESMQVRYLNKMGRQIDTITNLITHMLDVSKIQQGKLAYLDELFSIDDHIQDVDENIQEISPRNPINIAERTVTVVYGDRDRVGQVLTNLLMNATKYSPDEAVVTVGAHSRNDELEVYVQDRGVGISSEHHRKIFDRFYRVEGKEDNTYPGLGLGLYISNEIVKRHGGHMQVKSTKGKGTRFSFTIPINGHRH